MLSVDGHPVDGVLAAVEPLISRDNDQRVTWLGPEVLAWTPLIHALGLISDPGQATLAVRFPDQTTVTVAVESVAVESVAVGPQVLTGPRPAGWISLPDTVGAPMPLYLRNSDAPYWFEYLPDSGRLPPAQRSRRSATRGDRRVLRAPVHFHRQPSGQQAGHRPALERRREHLPGPAAAAQPDRLDEDQPARLPVRDHRARNVLCRPEHRDGNRA